MAYLQHQTGFALELHFICVELSTGSSVSMGPIDYAEVSGTPKPAKHAAIKGK
jgi:hypothetical protein